MGAQYEVESRPVVPVHPVFTECSLPRCRSLVGMTSPSTNAHRITVSEPVVAVRVEIEGVVVADTEHARVLQEGALPPRYYLPRADVRTDLLTATDLSTTCPFKGDASYWTLELDGVTHENVVWSYADPIPEMREIEGLLCFYNDRVTLHVRDELS
jgi:uncharacterized protein (DUF427 family)